MRSASGAKADMPRPDLYALLPYEMYPPAAATNFAVMHLASLPALCRVIHRRGTRSGADFNHADLGAAAAAWSPLAFAARIQPRCR